MEVSIGVGMPSMVSVLGRRCRAYGSDIWGWDGMVCVGLCLSWGDGRLEGGIIRGERIGRVEGIVW